MQSRISRAGGQNLAVVTSVILLALFASGCAARSVAAGSEEAISRAGRAIHFSRAPCGRLVVPSPPRHVVWIWFENRGYSQIIGSRSAPYINALAHACGLATNYHALVHDSLPNYIAATSGVQEIPADATPVSDPLMSISIFEQVASASYAGSMPSNCALHDAGAYVVRHNPEPYYLRIRRLCNAHNAPLTRFDPSKLARFALISPNTCDDMDLCPVSRGDKWLQAFLPRLLQTSDYRHGRTTIFVTFDEDDGSSGNHVPMLIIAASTPARMRDDTSFTHYSLLRTTEDLLGVRRLGHATAANSMASPFRLSR